MSQGSIDRMVVTSCFGERFWLAVGPWVKHLEALSDCPIEVVSLDGRAYDGDASTCRTFVADMLEAKTRYGTSALPPNDAAIVARDGLRLDRLLFHLGRDRTCVHVDLDVRMKRDFSALCRLPYDFIISRAFHFPPFAAQKLGFVACTGFYIAKPSARHICDVLFRNIEENRYFSRLDQYVLNAMLCEVVRDDVPRRETADLDGVSLDLDVFAFDGCSIAVLPREAIERNRETESSVFGNHDIAFIDEFLAQV